MRLINADKYLKETCTYKDTGCGSCIFQGKCIADEPTVFEIPDNPTNGDIIKAMFPEGVPKEIVWTLQAKKSIVWWNAPYERR